MTLRSMGSLIGLLFERLADASETGNHFLRKLHVLNSSLVGAPRCIRARAQGNQRERPPLEMLLAVKM
jgi:hypothetical protein